MVDATPKPQRAPGSWMNGRLIIESVLDGHKPMATQLLLERANITCRDCYGFGHGIKKCLTTVRIKKFKLINKMGKHLFATYSARASEKMMLVNDKNVEVWPLA